ncbi:MAG: transcription termination factor Rho [Alphaproteobacteria bacterium]|nr:transcription termination factor Rho [Rickettsiales bacterium]
MRPIRGHRSQREEEFDVKTAKTISSVNLRSKNVDDLIKIAGDYDVPNVNRLLKHNIISAILRSASSKGEVVYDTGVIEIVADNFGFLRYSENNYAPSSDNVYVSQNQVRRFGLKTGDIVEGYAKEPRRSEKYFSMFKIVKINNHLIGEIGNTLHFDNFTPIFPKDKLNLDLNIGIKGDVSTRLIDIIAPIGKGQRALIVAPPRSGKTVVMKNIAHAINANHPDVKLIALLIDERPEEFTDMIKCVSGEVVSSTFDEPAERHVALAEIIIAKAKRMVEQGQDVVVLLDSITRLARAYNTIAPSSGKILTGGIDSNALQRPKRFFGAARNITREGSLTIIATALVDTGSKMDEVIFEEFKGRGNSEIVLDRKLADKRLFPAIDVLRSGTRNEEEMVSGEILPKMWALRKILSGMNEQVKTGNAESIDFLLREIKKTTNNTEFFNRMNG